MKVRFSHEIGLYAVRCAETGLWLAGLLTEANRAEYVKRNGWEVVG